ncbi:RDD family protein [Microbacterium sp. CJ88]|uniref:RDD family protein n=1 Tax=Microbacterium sp. CJ88 TaxID=3445672 RepID=UPI003F655F5E
MIDQRSRPLPLIPASIGRRVGVYAIDVAVAALIPLALALIAAGVFSAVGRGWSERSLAVALLIAYLVIGALNLAWLLLYTALQGGRGSIGQRALGVQLRDATAGTPIGFWRALLRNVIWALAGSIVVGYFSPLFDSSGRRQGWHDQVARAIVIDRKATDAAASVVPLAPPAPLANPYLPPPAGAPAVPAPVPGTRFPSATPASPAPVGPPASTSAGFAPADFAPAGSPATPPASVPPPASTGMISAVPGVTSEPSEVRSIARTSEGSVESLRTSHDSPTSDAGEADDLDATRAGTARPIASLAWDDGTAMAVFGRTLFGRNPAPEDGAVAVAVRDETLSLSKTHFEVDGDASGVWVIDRHSTNGTILVRDGLRQQLAAGTRMPLRSGDRLEFGDRRVSVGGVA